MTTKAILILSFILLIINQACNNSGSLSKNDKQGQNDTNTIQKAQVELAFETNLLEKDYYKIGEKPILNIKLKGTASFDSIRFIFDKKEIKTAFQLPVEIKIENKIEKTGQNNLEAHIYISGSTIIQKYPITFISDIEPKKYSYEVVKVYPHDRKAFTQGLVFNGGYFYESNGITNESTLRKVQIGTGEPIQSYTLPAEIFAEGLTIMGNKIIQLSWQNHVGFVYDKNTFQVLAKFNYSTEGWGLTNDGKQLIMSDGTNILYYLDPQSYSAIYQIEVFDNKGPVNDLNELEYIDGHIYANIWKTDKIAQIDPKSGKVIAYIDLSKILPEGDYERDTDVLNGIAYDREGKRLFITGKRWPKLFEVKIKQQ